MDIVLNLNMIQYAIQNQFLISISKRLCLCLLMNVLGISLLQ